MELKRLGVGDSVGRESSFGEAFLPLYRRLFDEDGTFVADLERKLAESRMTDTVEMYLARALGVGVLAGVLLWLSGTAVAAYLLTTGVVDVGVILGARIPNETLLAVVQALKLPFLVLVSGLVLGFAGFTAGFGSLLSVPYFRSSSREREINMLLSDAISYMYSLSVGGLDQIEILRAMATADDTYGEVSTEFRSIVQETEYFDTDYRTAIRKQAAQTPSDELAQFLTDMLSIINSGGDMEQFLDDKKDKHMRTAKQQQEDILDTMELFGEMYMTLSLFPLLLIIILVIMALLGSADLLLLYLTVYGLVPVVGVAFLVLVAIFKWDEPGDGYLREREDRQYRSAGTGVFHFGFVEAFVGTYRIFDRIRTREAVARVTRFARRPHVVFRERPLATFVLTVPLTAALVGVAVLSGSAPTTWSGLVASPVWGTFVLAYAPAYLLFVPYAGFRFWNVRSRTAVLDNLSDDLRKLSSANDTGLTLLESIRLVGETSSGKLAAEFEEMYAKVRYGMSLQDALVSFNNRYHIPRLARTVRLVSKAQEASNHISAVLRTAAQASENQDDIDREQISRTRVQMTIIIMTYLTLLAVMAILKTQFLDTMARLATENTGGRGFSLGVLNVNLLSLLFFHAVTLQAVMAGLISGYIRESEVTAGVKYVLVLLTVALIVWAGVG